MIVILNANALHIPLADNSVHCVVTSTPYWGLRDYGLPPSIWGGDPDCEHAWWEYVQPAANGITADDGMSGETLSDSSATRKPKKSNFCSKCGAWKGCYGLEPSPELFVDHTVMIFREVRRVLRPDGTLWLNLGDSYNGSGGAGGDYRDGGLKEGQPRYPGRNIGTLKPKDLVGIPWRVAFALQADGWYLRMDNIWSKRNPMPESVRDRPTRSHEYMFLLSKSKQYFYDQDAIREKYTQATIARVSQPNFDKQTGGPKDPRNGGEGTMNRSARTGLENLAKRIPKNLQADGQRPNSMHIARANGEGEPEANPSGRNKFSVWTINTRPYAGAHFATYPPELVEPCIKAGTSERGCCPDCGAPWERVVSKGYRAAAEENVIAKMVAKGVPRQKANLYGSPSRDPKKYAEDPDQLLGWRPTCECYGIQIIEDQPSKPNQGQDESDDEFQGRMDRYVKDLAGWNKLWGKLKPKYDACKVVHAKVLDPFSGSGTTAMVARELGRDGIGLDLSLKYIQECAKERLGMNDLQAWTDGKKVEEVGLSDLPMFAGLE